MSIDLSIVIPVYNEEGNLIELAKSLIRNSPNIKLQLILVNDGSSDASWKIMNQLSDFIKPHNLVCINQWRNLGQQATIANGLRHATGDYVLIMDADLQHPPSLIPEIWMQRNDAQVIQLKQVFRNESKIKAFASIYFYKLLNFGAKNKIEPNVGEFRMFDKSVLQVLNSIQEPNKNLRILVNELKFTTKIINYQAAPRFNGKTQYTFKKMIELGIQTKLSGGMQPLKIGIVCSLSFFVISMFDFLYVILMWLSGATVLGWASIVGAIVLGFSGVFLLLTLIAYSVEKILYVMTGRQQVSSIKEVNIF